MTHLSAQEVEKLKAENAAALAMRREHEDAVIAAHTQLEATARAQESLQRELEAMRTQVG
jgi:predicted  nucleic acid-binding Zn-ribbon protein